MDKLTPKTAHHPVRHKASTLPYSQASGPQPVKSRHRGLLALLRRLSPRLKRTPSPDRQWVKVEPRPADRTSVASDHSFETTLQVRHAELLGYDVCNNSHQDIPQKSDGHRGSRGGLSGLLTSLKSSKPTSKQEKNASSGKEKRPEKEASGQHPPRNSGIEGHERHENGAATSPYNILKTQSPPPNVPATMVPALYLCPTKQVDSQPKADMTTTTVPLHTSTRPTATAQRPHTLNLPNRGQSRAGWTAAAGPPPHPQPLPPLPPALSYMTRPTQTTSVDSIGSCSLDVNATGTTSPATMEAVDGSRRSLRSVSLENNLSGATSPGVSIGTTPLRPILKPQPYTDPGSINDPGGTVGPGFKTPSYLGISCAVNGYSRLNRYDSSLRDGFRSRDASPARLAFSRSRDSSPMRPEWKLFDLRTRASPQETSAKIKELKEELARFKAEFPLPQPERGRQNSSRKLGRKPSQGRSISVDRGYLTKAGTNGIMNGHHHNDAIQVGSNVRLVEIKMSDSSKVRTSSYQYSFEQSVVRDGEGESSESIHSSSRTDGETPQKSFIQSRIERLYGPSALGVGFRSRRSLLELEKEQKDRQSAGYCSPSSQIDNHYDPEEEAPEGFPSVFRHLRPEFRTQLQVKRNTRLRPDITLDTSLDTDSPKRPGRVIPITLTDTIEKPQTPPVLLPKPQNLINNKSKMENGVRDSNVQQVIVKKIVNGNGNIKEMEIPIVKELYLNGGIEEKENNSGVPNETLKRTSSKVNGVSEIVQVNGDISSSSKGEKDGHYFLKVVDGVVSSLEADVASIEPDLENCRSEMSEEVRGKLLAAIGKARLLISQKIRQFQGLCHKNIAGSAGEEFPTTCEDLAGFWDMVFIQVEDIRQLIKEIEDLKANGWKEVPTVDTVDGTGNVSTGRARKKPAPRPIRAAKSTKASSEKSEEGKARDEARKKLMEERRKAMKEALKAKKAEAEAKQGDVDSVEIFAPDNKLKDHIST